MTKILSCLGVCLDSGAIGFPESSEGSAEGREETLSPLLDLMTAFRDEIRTLAQNGASAKELRRRVRRSARRRLARTRCEARRSRRRRVVEIVRCGRVEEGDRA